MTAPAHWFGGCRGLEEQLAGLAPVLERAAGARVLDLGCAEGHIAAEFVKRGAAGVSGCEILVERVEAARAHVGRAGLFFSCDLDYFDKFIAANPGLFRARYDIVLALSIAHKLAEPEKFLWRICRLAKAVLAIRLPDPVLNDARSGHRPLDVPAYVTRRGFVLESENRAHPRGEWLGIFRRDPPAAA